MLFVAIVDGKITIVHAFIEHTSRTVSVNGACYLALLNEVVFLNQGNTKAALVDAGQCTTSLHGWCRDRSGWEVSRACHQQIEVPMSSGLPTRLTWIPLTFISGLQSKVSYTVKTDTIESLVQVFKQFAASYKEGTIWKVASNVLKRARLWREANGGTLHTTPLVVLCCYYEV